MGVRSSSQECCFTLKATVPRLAIQGFVAGAFMLFLANTNSAEIPRPNSVGDVFVMGSYEAKPSRIIGTLAIRQYILKQNGIDIEFRVVPSKRTPYAVLNGMIDAMAVSDNTAYDRDQFVHAKYPTHVYNVYIYYRNSAKWNPTWPAKEEFKRARGASKYYTYFNTKGFNISLVPSFQSGVMMVNAGRADYWLEVFSTRDPTIIKHIKPKSEGFNLDFLYPNPLRLAFANNEKGRYYKDILDQGLIELLDRPEELKRVYMGPFANVPGGSALLTAMFDDYYTYMRAQYPELNLQ